jgi:hypothetical protein
MGKDTKIERTSVNGKAVTRPIGSAKASKFAAVEGLKMNAGSKALAEKLTAAGLKGDAYRAEIVKAFKKG